MWEPSPHPTPHTLPARTYTQINTRRSPGVAVKIPRVDGGSLGPEGGWAEVRRHPPVIYAPRHLMCLCEEQVGSPTAGALCEQKVGALAPEVGGGGVGGGLGLDHCPHVRPQLERQEGRGRLVRAPGGPDEPATLLEDVEPRDPQQVVERPAPLPVAGEVQYALAVRIDPRAPAPNTSARRDAGGGRMGEVGVRTRLWKRAATGSR